MAICQSCSRNLKWYQFKREICPDCAKHWNSVLAGTKLTSSESENLERDAPEGEFYDLNTLLTSIRIREDFEQNELLADVWAPSGYPTQSLMASLVLHIGLVFLIWGLSGVSFSQPLRLTKSDLERHYEITYYKPSDLLPAMKSSSDGPKEPAGNKPKLKPPKGSASFPPNSNDPVFTSRSRQR